MSNVFKNYRPYAVLPEVNSTTLNPWIQPYSYATARSTIHKIHPVDGVLTQPTLVTTISPIIASSQNNPTSTKQPLTIPSNKQNHWGEVARQDLRNNTELYKEEFLFPPERFKIVEENLFYEVKVIFKDMLKCVWLGDCNNLILSAHGFIQL